MNAKLKSAARGIAALLLVAAVGALQGTAQAQDTVKVGVLQSLTGTMAISEVTVKNATMLAIDRDQRRRRRASANKIDAGGRGRRLRSRHVRAEGAEADPGR